MAHTRYEIQGLGVVGSGMIWGLNTWFLVGGCGEAGIDYTGFLTAAWGLGGGCWAWFLLLLEPLWKSQRVGASLERGAGPFRSFSGMAHYWQTFLLC